MDDDDAAWDIALSDEPREVSEVEGPDLPTERTGDEDVCILSGSFLSGASERDCLKFFQTQPPDLGMAVAPPCEGNKFPFDELPKCKFIVVATSSQLGYPPETLWELYYNLKQCADLGLKPFIGVQHAVFGNGLSVYEETYMNVPRLVDEMLEQCGSRRFHARGEVCVISSADWGIKMWESMKTADKSAPPVAWDALWGGGAAPVNKTVVHKTLADIVKTFGEPSKKSRLLAKL
jgi:hypothetical protein